MTHAESYQRRKAWFQEYGKKNRERMREYQAAWRAANRAKYNEYRRVWNAKKNGTKPAPARPQPAARPAVEVPREGTLRERFRAYRQSLASK